MTTIEQAVGNSVDTDVAEFASTAAAQAEKVFRVFRQTGTISKNGTVNFVERVPGHDLLVALNDPGPWADDPTVVPVITDLKGKRVHSDAGWVGFAPIFGALFQARPEITTAVHVHSPWLGAWAQTHRWLPLRYAASQRVTLSREIPPHIDRSQPPAEFMLEQLERDPHLVAIFEANGGSNVIGRRGLLDTAKFIVLLEEGAEYQARAESLGGSVELDPSNLVVQWRRGGILEQAIALGLVPEQQSPEQ